MALFGFELEEIARLIAMADAQGLEEFIYEEEGRFLRIRGPRAAKAPRVLTAAPVPIASSDIQVSSPASGARRVKPPVKKTETFATANQIVLESPMMGVFYRAEKAGVPPLVNVGDHVSIGQTVGILEAMKVFSEFKAEHAGQIVSIPAQDGKLVQAGAPLIVLKKE